MSHQDFVVTKFLQKKYGILGIFNLKYILSAVRVSLGQKINIHNRSEKYGKLRNSSKRTKSNKYIKRNRVTFLFFFLQHSSLSSSTL